MTEFSYTAADADGTNHTGMLHAADEAAARKLLTKKGLAVSDLRSLGMPWATTDAGTGKTKAVIDMEYAPLQDTLRLFAGWLLAWYGLVYAIGGLRAEQSITADIPVIDALFQSPLLLRLTFGTFLFLIVSSIHAWTGRGITKGIVLTLIWAVVMVGFVLNA